MIPALPSLQALRILEAAARLRSYSAAAEELRLTHGAVSRQIHAMEHWAGSKLFRREGKRMEPTQAGLALVTRTREALAMLGDLAFASGAPSKTSPGLVVSTTPAFARFWLIPRLEKLHAEFPDLICEVEADSALFESHTRRVDVAIRYGRGGWTDILYEQIGRTDKVIALASPALANQVRNRQDLAQLPLIETPYHSWRSWLAAAGYAPATNYRAILKASDSSIALDMCIAGLGIALVRDRLAAFELQSGRLVRVHHAEVTEAYEYYAVWRSNSRQRKNIQILTKWLTREMADTV
jgi:DNA-binding transcriptional LysR family regulator